MIFARQLFALCLIGLPLFAIAEGAAIQTLPVGKIENNGRHDFAVSESAVLRTHEGGIYVLDPRSGAVVVDLPRPEGLGRAFAKSLAVEGDAVLACGAARWDRHEGLNLRSVLMSMQTGEVLAEYEIPRDVAVQSQVSASDQPCAIEGPHVAIGYSEDISRKIGKPGTQGRKIGSVVLYDRATGEPRHRIFAPHDENDGTFGEEVALWRGELLVLQRASGRNPREDRTAVYRFDAETGDFLGALWDSGPKTNWFVQTMRHDRSTLALSLAATYHEHKRNGTINRVMLIDIASGAPVAAFASPDPEGTLAFGHRVALQAPYLLASEGFKTDRVTALDGKAKAQVHLFNTETGAHLKTFAQPYRGAHFGLNLAVTQDMAFIEQRSHPDWEDLGRVVHIYALSE